MKKTMTYLLVVVMGMMIIMLTANCGNKKSAEKADTADTTQVNAEDERAIRLSLPPFKKFVVVTVEESGLYKEPDKGSPTLVSWGESNCESDYCEQFFQWSDQPGKEGFELDSDINAGEGRVFPVLGEEGDFYKVCTLTRWCEIESAYIPKADVGDIESVPVKADELEQQEDEFYFRCRVMRDGKYRDVVLCDNYDELSGETLGVGLLQDGVVMIPCAYQYDSFPLNEQKEDVIVKVEEGNNYLTYSKGFDTAISEDDYSRINLKKLNDQQIAAIVDSVAKQKPTLVQCMYLFQAKGPEYFYYNAK